MSPNFERDRKRAVVTLWRAGWSFDAVRDYVGMGPDEAARILWRALNMGPIDPTARTLGDVMRDERRAAARPAEPLAIPASRVEALLPSVTTPRLRAHLLSSLTSRGVNLGGAA